MSTPYDLVILATSGLVAYWPLGPGTYALDDVGSNDATLVNTPTTDVAITPITAGDVGMTFASASSEHATVADNAAFDFGTGDYSIEFWCLRNGDPSADEYFVTQGVQGAGGTGFELAIGGGGGSYLSSRINTVTANSKVTTITNNAWHHVALSMDRDGNANFYKDGVVDNLSDTPTDISSQSGYSVTTTGTLYLARRAAGNYWNGGLAKVALYNVALSSGTVSDHYAARTATAATSVNAGHSSATGTGYDVDASIRPAAGLAAATGTAYSPSLAAKTNAGLAAATGAAYSPSLSAQTNAGLATATGEAFAPSLHVVPGAGHAAAEGWASAATSSDLDVDAGLAEATGEAFAASLGVAPVAGSAEATGTAYDVLTGIGASPTAGLAEGTGAANAASASIAPSAGHASATGEAYAPSLSLSLDASLASAQASALAFDPTVQLVSGTFPTAEHAAATGEAYALSPSLATNSDHASATAAAYSPSLHIQSNADHASATVTAQQVAIALSLYPALAEAIAAAYPLLATIVMTAGHASATGEAYQPPIVQPAQAGPVGSITGGYGSPGGLSARSAPGSLSGRSSPGTVTAAR